MQNFPYLIFMVNLTLVNGWIQIRWQFLTHSPLQIFYKSTSGGSFMVYLIQFGFRNAN